MLNIEMQYWYSTIYKACIYAGIISFIIGLFTKPNTSLDAYITGFSVFTIGILMILVILFSNVLRATQNDSFSQTMYSILMTAGPFILILAIIGFILNLLINYRNNIIDGHVSTTYNTFITIIIVLIISQFYLVNSNINTEKFESTGKLSPLTSSIIYLLGVTTSICSIILYIILKYYSTDGFSQMFN